MSILENTIMQKELLAFRSQTFRSDRRNENISGQFATKHLKSSGIQVAAKLKARFRRDGLAARVNAINCFCPKRVRGAQSAGECNASLMSTKDNR